MLVPVWKALCAATDCKESYDQFKKMASLLVYAKRSIYTIFEPKEPTEIDKVLLTESHQLLGFSVQSLFAM